MQDTFIDPTSFFFLQLFLFRKGNHFYSFHIQHIFSIRLNKGNLMEHSSHTIDMEDGIPWIPHWKKIISSMPADNFLQAVKLFFFFCNLSSAESLADPFTAFCWHFMVKGAIHTRCFSAAGKRYCEYPLKPVGWFTVRCWRALCFVARALNCPCSIKLHHSAR